MRDIRFKIAIYSGEYKVLNEEKMVVENSLGFAAHIDTMAPDYTGSLDELRPIVLKCMGQLRRIVKYNRFQSKRLIACDCIAKLERAAGNMNSVQLAHDLVKAIDFLNTFNKKA